MTKPIAKPNGWESQYDEFCKDKHYTGDDMNDWCPYLDYRPGRKKNECDCHVKDIKEFVRLAILSAEERAFKKIVALRSPYVYDDYSTLYQQSEKIWVEYSKVEGEFLKEKLSLSLPDQEQLSNSKTE